VTSTPSKTTVVKTVNNKTGVTKSVSTTTSGGSTTVTKTTTIGKPATTTNAAIEALYRAAGGIGRHSPPLAAVLSAAADSGLAGCRLAGYRAAASPDDADLLLLALAGEEQLHAAACLDGLVITWGAEIPLSDLDATIEAAWSLTWHGQEERCGR
jgi:hypothetical protein